MPESSERSIWGCSESETPWADPPSGALPSGPSKEVAPDSDSSPAQVWLSSAGSPCWSLTPGVLPARAQQEK